MPYKLYNRTGSGGFAVEAGLTLAGEDFELILIDSKPGTSLPDSFREINPWRQVPTLFTKDGTMMTETSAILIHIALTHPVGEVGPPLGTPEHAKFLRWVVFMSVNIYEGTLRRIYPERFTTDPNGSAGVRAAAIDRNRAAFALIENELQPNEYISGSTMSVVDIYLAMLFAWQADHASYPLCSALTHRVASHSVVAPIWQRSGDEAAREPLNISFLRQGLIDWASLSVESSCNPVESGAFSMLFSTSGARHLSPAQVKVGKRQQCELLRVVLGDAAMLR